MRTQQKITGLFNHSNENWLRNANPLSVGIEYMALPMLTLVLWSRQWIGWWFLVLLILFICWKIFSPILFDTPMSTKNWASKAVLGKQVYRNRYKIDIPKTYKTLLSRVQKTVSLIGKGLALYSAVIYSVDGAVFGIMLSSFGKTWYLDHMFWLYEDMKNEYWEYFKWEY